MKMKIKMNDKYLALSNFSIYYAWKNIKNPYKNKFKISGPTWNEKFGSFSVSDIQDYFCYIIKNLKIVTDNPAIRIYINKIEKESHLKFKKCIVCNF